MGRIPQDDVLRRQTETFRAFNRYYTMRLGLLRGRYLQSEFSLTQARILYELAQESEITAASLRRLFSLDAGYMSRLLTALEKRGLVRRKPSEKDGRARLLQLTASGKRLAAASIGKRRRRWRCCWERFRQRTGSSSAGA